MMSWRHITAKPNSVALGVLAGLFVLILVMRDVSRPSPGELARVHARVPELANHNCEACHGSGTTTLVEACFKCHVEIGAQFREKTGFHGRLGAPDATTCTACHSEHHGAHFPLVSSRSFQLAGIPRPAEYDHAGLTFRLNGKHLLIGCTACHPFASGDLLPVGQKRFLGLRQQCTACHADVHRGSYGQDCEACHGQQHPFSLAAAFEHTAAFPLQAAHAGVACQACHAKDSPSAVDRLWGRNRSPVAGPVDVRPCQACHQSPHSVPFLETAARYWGLPGDESCEVCHALTQSAFHGPQALMTDDFHAAIGYPLTAPHEEVTCDQCHPGYGEPKGSGATYAAAYPQRRAADCRACHGDPHDGQFLASPPVVDSCLSCHDRDRFVPAAFGREEHQRTRFPIRGAHAGLACGACHRRIPAAPGDSAVDQATIGFRGTPTSCRACHADPHQGQFDAPSGKQHDCDDCHQQESFRRSTFSLLAHAQTRFPLTGAHQAVACQSCHPPLGTIAATDPSASVGSPVERLYRGLPLDCVGCHEDVHGGAFDRPDLPQRVNGATGCLRCHGTERFDEVAVSGFEHALWTGYPLTGAHGRAECRDCHAISRVPDADGRTFGRVAGDACQECHQDPHAGQFGPTLEVDCRRCHVAGDSFQEIVFDHQAHSRFRLDDQHLGLACDACHKPQPLPDGSFAIRYRPLGTQCGDCHVPRGPRPSTSRRSP